MAARISAIREIMADKGCTHALITDAVDVEYLSGFRASEASLLISARGVGLLTDFRYAEAAEKFCRGRRGWKFTITEGGNFEHLKKNAAISAGASIGFQSNVMTVDKYRALRRALSKSKLVPLPDALSDISARKLDVEIDSMRKAARIGDRAFKALLPLIKTPMTEIGLARLLERICADLGSQKPAFDTIALFGERSALPHGRPTDRKLRKGDFVLLDFGCVADGFRSDMTRTIVCGKASDEQRNIYDIVLRAQTAARAKAKPGATCSAVDAAARDIIEKSGHGKNFGHATGHGVGLRIHEKPRLHKKNNATLVENNVVTIEPGIYIPDVGGVRIEDMLVLKKGGAETLTQTHRKFTELTI